MQISDHGLDIIKAHESLRLEMYYCPANKPTIGWGHLILPSEQDLMTRTITVEEAEALLRNDVGIAERAVNSLVEVELNQNQFDALVSFVFNIGVGNFRSSTLLKRLNEEDYNGAAGQFERWVYANKRTLPGLIRRREEERDLFLEPVVKPLAESRTIWGASAAAFGATALEASDWAAQTVPAITPYASSGWMKSVLFVIAISGALLALYARIDDHRRKRK